MDFSNQIKAKDTRSVASFSLNAVRKIKSQSVLVIGLGGVGSEITKHLLLNGVSQVYFLDQTSVKATDFQYNFFTDTKNLLGMQKDEQTIQIFNQIISGESVLKTFDIATPIDEQLTSQSISAIFLSDLDAFYELPLLYSNDSFSTIQKIEKLRALQEICQRLSIQLYLSFSFGVDGMLWNIKSQDNICEFLNERNMSNHIKVENINDLARPERIKVMMAQKGFQEKINGLRLIKAFLWIKEQFLSPQEILQKLFDDQEIGNNEYLDCQKRIEYMSKFQNVNLITISSIVAAFSVYEWIKSLEESPIAANPLLKTFTQFERFKHFDYSDLMNCSVLDYQSNNESEEVTLSELLGQDIIEKFNKLKIFIPGVGGLGCELLKLISCLCGQEKHEGEITIADYDSVQHSNLNRQFLFSYSDKNKPKTQTAKASILRINPVMKIQCFDFKMDPQSESQMDSKFWNSQDVILNGLDNVQAREFIQNRCIIYEKPFFEMGVDQMSGRQYPLLPNLTISYSELKVEAPNQNTQVKSCTIKTFPEQTIHCLQWARERFEELFDRIFILLHQITMIDIEDINANHENKALLNDSVQLRMMSIIGEILSLFAKQKGMDQETFKMELVKYAIDLALIWYVDEPNEILKMHPADSTFSDGKKVWEAPRKQPKPLILIENQFILQFVSGLIGILCTGMDPSLLDKDNEDKINSLTTITREQIQTQIELRDQNKVEIAKTIMESDSIIDRLRKQLSDSKIMKISPLSFDKDNIFHLQFVHAAGNMRCNNFEIDESTFENSIQRVGNIQGQNSLIISIVTAAAVNELLLYLQGKPLKFTEISLKGFIFGRFPVERFSENEANPWKVKIIRGPKLLDEVCRELYPNDDDYYSIFDIQATELKLNLFTLDSNEELLDKEVIEACMIEAKRLKKDIQTLNHIWITIAAGSSTQQIAYVI